MHTEVGLAQVVSVHCQRIGKLAARVLNELRYLVSSRMFMAMSWGVGKGTVLLLGLEFLLVRGISVSGFLLVIGVFVVASLPISARLWLGRKTSQISHRAPKQSSMNVGTPSLCNHFCNVREN
jgi:hypothetical protein